MVKSDVEKVYIIIINNNSINGTETLYYICVSIAKLLNVFSLVRNDQELCCCCSTYCVLVAKVSRNEIRAPWDVSCILTVKGLQ